MGQKASRFAACPKRRSSSSALDSGVDVFITREKAILSARDRIGLRVRIMSPASFSPSWRNHPMTQLSRSPLDRQGPVVRVTITGKKRETFALPKCHTKEDPEPARLVFSLFARNGSDRADWGLLGVAGSNPAAPTIFTPVSAFECPANSATVHRMCLALRHGVALFAAFSRHDLGRRSWLPLLRALSLHLGKETLQLGSTLSMFEIPGGGLGSQGVMHEPAVVDGLLD
jgi:hypothetical protein